VREITYRQSLNEALAECQRHGMFVGADGRSAVAPLGASHSKRSDAAPTGLGRILRVGSYKHDALTALKI